MPPPTPDEQTTPAESPNIMLTPARKRMGQAPLARAIKATLRPIFKLLYYTIRWIRSHKLAALLAILLIVGSVFATNYLLAGQIPFSPNTSTNTQQQSGQASSPVSSDVQDWLLALRSGDLNTMLNIQKSMSRQPDSSMYLLQFSEKYAQVKWTAISVNGASKGPDGMLDLFIEVDMTSTSTSSSSTSAATTITLWHFTTSPTGHIYTIDYVSGRSA
ncbi:hypothetical protein KDH_45400 [Dictyobacter sp. S3.2.2.5]|uniref:Uncharacterized protein n=2 Tax=Dictyobacter halimunensis TaxID=3026934 RepID=A0ABQ6FXZ3_9CHLR|nr:hypothetical protein KDH_45400 [Dictyobacter sp. S3.2.2.5]